MTVATTRQLKQAECTRPFVYRPAAAGLRRRKLGECKRQARNSDDSPHLAV